MSFNSIIISTNCTYCGGDIEDNFSRCGLAAAILLFPIGEFSFHLISSRAVDENSLFSNIRRRLLLIDLLRNFVNTSNMSCISRMLSNCVFAGLVICCATKERKCVICDKIIV